MVFSRECNLFTEWTLSSSRFTSLHSVEYLNTRSIFKDNPPLKRRLWQVYGYRNQMRMRWNRDASARHVPHWTRRYGTHLTYVWDACFLALWVSRCRWAVFAVSLAWICRCGEREYRYPALRTNERTHGRAAVILNPGATKSRETRVTVSSAAQTRPFPSWKPSSY